MKKVKILIIFYHVMPSMANGQMDVAGWMQPMQGQLDVLDVKKKIIKIKKVKFSTGLSIFIKYKTTDIMFII